MSAGARRVRDLPGDPGLERTLLRGPGGPRVGTPRSGPLRRFFREPALDRLFRELQRGFGPQLWWPAETPFEVIVGSILTQNTSWRNVEHALAALKRRARLSPAALLSLEAEELARLIRPSGTFRSKARKLREVSRWYLDVGGLQALRTRPLEPLRDELLGVWGVGPETADSILCYAAGRRTAVVDTYARRVLGRHGCVDLTEGSGALRAFLMERLVPSQAAYEEFHALCVRAGSAHCKPTPRCELCPATAPAAEAGRVGEERRGSGVEHARGRGLYAFGQTEFRGRARSVTAPSQKERHLGKRQVSPWRRSKHRAGPRAARRRGER